MSEDGRVGNWIAGLLFERRRKNLPGNNHGQSPTARLIRDLVPAAISGALFMLLVDYVISSIVPQYWPPGHRGAVAIGGTMGASLAPLWTWLKAMLKPENPD
jgi:hypothetical protein